MYAALLVHFSIIFKRCTHLLPALNSNLAYKNYEANFARNSNTAYKVTFVKSANIKRFSMWAINEWYSEAGVEVKLCDLPADVIPDGSYYKYMQFDSGKNGHVSIHDKAIYLLPVTNLESGAKIVLQDVYF